MIQFSRPAGGRSASALEFSAGTAAERAAWREEFRDRHIVRLPRLLHETLLAPIIDGIARGEFFEKVHPGVKVEHALRPNAAFGLLTFAANDRRLFEVVEEITGCTPIASFVGRVYRMEPAAGHHDAWHTDNADGRMVAMSVNLSSWRYAGGRLQLRARGTERPIAEVANTGLGDAIVFRIDERLEHRVTDVTGTAAKTAFAGWLKSGESSPLVTRRSELSVRSHV